MRELGEARGRVDTAGDAERNADADENEESNNFLCEMFSDTCMKHMRVWVKRKWAKLTTQKWADDVLSCVACSL